MRYRLAKKAMGRDLRAAYIDRDFVAPRRDASILRRIPAWQVWTFYLRVCAGRSTSSRPRRGRAARRL